MIEDIVEKNVGTPRPPSAPKAPQPSLWKQRVRASRKTAAFANSTTTNGGSAASPAAAQSGPTPLRPAHQGPPLSEQEQIHLENLKKMSAMTPDDIEREREQLISSMDPEVLKSLLKRAEIKDGMTQQSNLTDSVAEPVAKNPAPPSVPPTVSKQDPDVHQKKDDNEDSGKPHLHFPAPPDDLKKYFPDTPVETSKLAWMQPVAPEEELEYSEELASVAPSQLRFDFTGNLLTPRISSQIDTSVGLHHHADAPGAAGYTIPELAHLARSSHASQRSLAIQTIGRVLHKLVNGKYNKSSELQYALEKLVQSTRIEETLLEASSEKTRSLTVRAHATEALWLYHNKSEHK